MHTHSAARAAILGLKIVSRTSSPTSKRSKANDAATSFARRLPFLLPLNTPVLVRLLEQLRTMRVDDVALVETVALAIAKGQF